MKLTSVEGKWLLDLLNTIKIFKAFYVFLMGRFLLSIGSHRPLIYITKPIGILYKRGTVERCTYSIEDYLRQLGGIL